MHYAEFAEDEVSNFVRLTATPHCRGIWGRLTFYLSVRRARRCCRRSRTTRPRSGRSLGRRSGSRRRCVGLDGRGCGLFWTDVTRLGLRAVCQGTGLESVTLPTSACGKDGKANDVVLRYPFARILRGQCIKGQDETDACGLFVRGEAFVASEDAGKRRTGTWQCCGEGHENGHRSWGNERVVWLCV